MNKILYILIIIISIPIFSQNWDEQPSYLIGVKVGINLSTVDADGNYHDIMEHTVGYSIGGFLLVPINNLLSLQGEFIYNQRGYNFTLDDISDEIVLNYFEIPILLGVKLHSNCKIYGGGYISYFLNKSRVDGNNYQYLDEKKIEKMDNGFIAGIMFRSYNLVVDFRFSKGIKNLLKKDQNGDNWSNQQFQVSFGVLF